MFRPKRVNRTIISDNKIHHESGSNDSISPEKRQFLEEFNQLKNLYDEPDRNSLTSWRNLMNTKQTNNKPISDFDRKVNI